MSELFDTIEMKALDAAEQERLAYEEKQAERKRLAYEKQAERKRAAKAKRTKATYTLLTRVGSAALVCLLLWLAGKFDLMNDHLVLCLYAAIFSWLCIWIGAWFQFMWCKGGLLEW